MSDVLICEESIKEILAQHPPLKPQEIDCVTAVMLKILDGKCKMPAHEKVIMEELYMNFVGKVGIHTGQSHHELIKKAVTVRAHKGHLDDETRDEVYEQRLYVETMISRPIMKGFKAMLREIGVLPKR